MVNGFLVKALTGLVLIGAVGGGWYAISLAKQEREERAYLLDAQKAAAESNVRAAFQGLADFRRSEGAYQSQPRRLLMQIDGALTSVNIYQQSLSGVERSPAKEAEVLASLGVKDMVRELREVTEKAMPVLARASQADTGLKAAREELSSLEQHLGEHSQMSAVCSKAFDRAGDHIALDCVDVGRATRVVLLVHEKELARASYPFNGRFFVLSEGIKPMAMMNSNGMTTWGSTEMMPVFRVVDSVSVTKAQEHKRELLERLTLLQQVGSDVDAELRRILMGNAKPSSTDLKALFGDNEFLVQPLKFKSSGEIDFGNMAFPGIGDTDNVLKDGSLHSPMSGEYTLDSVKQLDINDDGQSDYVVTLISSYYGGIGEITTYIHYLAIRQGDRIAVGDIGYNDASASEVDVAGSYFTVWPAKYGSGESLIRLEPIHAATFTIKDGRIIRRPYKKG